MKLRPLAVNVALVLAACIDQSPVANPGEPAEPQPAQNNETDLSYPTIVLVNCTLGVASSIPEPTAAFPFAAPPRWPDGQQLAQISFEVLQCEDTIMGNESAGRAIFAWEGHTNITDAGDKIEYRDYTASVRAMRWFADGTGIETWLQSHNVSFISATVDFQSAHWQFTEQGSLTCSYQSMPSSYPAIFRRTFAYLDENETGVTHIDISYIRSAGDDEVMHTTIEANGGYGIEKSLAYRTIGEGACDNMGQAQAGLEWRHSPWL